MSEEESVERLLREAGRRPALPEQDLASIREAARAEWRLRYAGRRTPARRSWWMALAAAVLLAAVGLVWSTRTRPGAIAPAVASVERVNAGARWQIGSPLAVGLEVETAGEETGRLALRMAGGASVRLDSGTRARLASANLIELERGAVYVDTGSPAAGGAAEVAVRAPAGLFQPAGTQFQVRVEAGATRLQVREGSVALERGRESVRAASGEELVARGDGSVERGRVDPFGPEWEWVLATAPMPDIEGLKVRSFLDWIAREAGRRVEFADSEAAALADSVELHGSIEHLTPLEATGVVLSSAGLEHRLSNGTLVVFVSKKGRQ